MLNFSTSNDLSRSNLPRADEDVVPEYDHDLTENLVFFREMLDSLVTEPREECVDTILAYSRSLK